MCRLWIVLGTSEKRILKVASFVVCFVIMLDTVQAQKNKIDPKAVIDHIRETEPELWEKHGGKEYDRSLRNAKPNGEHYWIGNLLIVLAVVGYISYLVASAFASGSNSLDQMDATPESEEIIRNASRELKQILAAKAREQKSAQGDSDYSKSVQNSRRRRHSRRL